MWGLGSGADGLIEILTSKTEPAGAGWGAEQLCGQEHVRRGSSQEASHPGSRCVKGTRLVL